jgi:Fe-S cluster biogenesis protein NfuA/nitrite reductase/ring-hydroxylating ferredoxin subunit
VQGLRKKEFERHLSRVESRIREVEALEPEARSVAIEAIRAVLDLHGGSLDRLLEMVVEREQGRLLGDFAQDEMVSGLLLLHGLHPLSLEERVQMALDRVKPYLGSHGGDVELVSLRDGVARLRLQGSCEGCPSSTMTLRYAIERELADAAPDLVDLQVDGLVEPRPPNFVPLTAIRSVPKRPPTEGGWQAVAGLEGMRSGEVRLVEGALFVKLGGNHYAYRETCPACAGSLSGATVRHEILTCPGCAVEFDARHAGRRLDDGGSGLTPIPLLVDAGQVQVVAAALTGAV